MKLHKTSIYLQNYPYHKRPKYPPTITKIWIGSLILSSSLYYTFIHHSTSNPIINMDALTINPSLSRHKLPPKLHLTTTPPPFSRHFHLHFRPPVRPTTLTITTTLAATVENPTQFSDYNEEETYGEVKRIIGSRALEDNTGIKG